MGLFSKSRKNPGAAPRGAPSSRITHAELEGYGRFEFDAQNNPLPGDLEYRAHQWSQADQDGFLTAMAGAAREGGWAAYGAERLVVSVISGDLKHPAFDEVMSSALAFLREHAVPPSRLSGYEWSWWSTHDGVSEPWLVGSPPPTAQEAADVAALADGEERVLAQIAAHADANLIVALQRDGVFVAQIDASWSDEDPTRSRNDWQFAPTLQELYTRVGAALQVTTALGTA